MKIILRAIDSPPEFTIQIIDDNGHIVHSGMKQITSATTKGELEAFEAEEIAKYELDAQKNQAIEAEKAAAADKAKVLAGEIGIVAEDGTLEKLYSPK